MASAKSLANQVKGKSKEEDDDLMSQHGYVQREKAKPHAFSLVAPATFIRSIRDLGYKSTLTALDELIDNSIQANAGVVEVFLAYMKENKSQKKPDFIIAADDGHGMEPDMIRLAVKWGGTHRENNRSGFGRYGFGLPSACVSIGRRYTVYSKEPGKAWYAVTIDIDEVSKGVEEGNLFEPQARKEKPPPFVDDRINLEKLDSGTVVVIEVLDRVDFKTTQAFVRNMLEHVGVVYRKMVPAITFKVDGMAVEPVDPLFLDEHARWYDETEVRAQPVDPIVFELDGPGGERGRVRIRAAWFPFNFQLVDPTADPRGTKKNNRHRIMKAYNGIAVCRAGRQIDTVTHLADLTFVNFDRYWKIEINFEPVLDEYFGITTHKQQVVFSESLIDHLKNHGLVELIKDLRKKMKASRAEIIAVFGRGEKAPRASEVALAETQSRKPRPKPSQKQAKKAEENLERQARKRAEITGESVEKEKERLHEEVKERPYKVDFEAQPDGPIYRGERLGPQYRLILNTSHRFYSEVYEPAHKVPGLPSKIEAALFVLAEAELDATEDQEIFYKAARVYGSQRLTDVLADLDGITEREDEASAEMEDAEAEANNDGTG